MKLAIVSTFLALASLLARSLKFNRRWPGFVLCRICDERTCAWHAWHSASAWRCIRHTVFRSFLWRMPCLKLALVWLFFGDSTQTFAWVVSFQAVRCRPEHTLIRWLRPQTSLVPYGQIPSWEFASHVPPENVTWWPLYAALPGCL